jgi:hypothetical protein
MEKEREKGKHGKIQRKMKEEECRPLLKFQSHQIFSLRIHIHSHKVLIHDKMLLLLENL